MELDLLNDYNQILIIEHRIRGGILQRTKRYAKAIINI